MAKMIRGRGNMEPSRLGATGEGGRRSEGRLAGGTQRGCQEQHLFRASLKTRSYRETSKSTATLFLLRW